ncbi:hypothetical protein ACG9ZK_14115, partial [Acinetobacter sp. ULE_I046]
FRYSDIQIFRYSDIQIFRYSDIQIFRYSDIQIDYYSQYFNPNTNSFIDDQKIYPMLLAFFDSINTDFDPLNINSIIVILNFKKMMMNIIKKYS